MSRMRRTAKKSPTASAMMLRVGKLVEPAGMAVGEELVEEDEAAATEEDAAAAVEAALCVESEL